MTSIIKKEVQVIMLPCNKAEIGTIMKYIKQMEMNDEFKLNTLCLNKNWKVAETNGNKYWQPQHLYFVDDSPIKEGDWFLMNHCILRQCSYVDVYMVVDTIGGKHHNSVCKKVISTTDKSLISPQNFPLFTYLPQPSDSFIAKYIEIYNVGTPIKDVMVDYIPNWLPEMFEPGDYPEVPLKYELLIDKNNTITITSCKNNWSREELQKLFDSYGDNFAAKIIWEDILKL